MSYEQKPNSFLDCGRLRANRYADDENALRLPAEDNCDNLKSCEDSYTGSIPVARTLKGISLNSETFLVATLIGGGVTTIAYSDEDAVKNFLRKAYEELEYDVYYEYKGTVNGGNVDVVHRHIGEATHATFIHDDDSTVALTRCCTLNNYLGYRAQVVDTIPLLKYGSNTHTMANNPYAYSGVPATDSATAAQMRTDFIAAMTALGAAQVDVTVEVSDENSAFYINYLSPSEPPVYVGNTPFSACGYVERYVCA